MDEGIVDSLTAQSAMCAAANTSTYKPRHVDPQMQQDSLATSTQITPTPMPR